ncbi:glucan biosynthesis glucosyltransferase H, partial [Stutzerimonas stutzeri]|nr:glucan biosynthesis glucosyltransferase H [Stutzerimonas stutzeri]
MNRMAEGYCDGLALNDVEDPARYRQAAEQGGLLALHDEMSAATTAERGPSRRLLDSVVTRLRMGWGDLFDRAGIIREDHQGRPYLQSTPPIVRTRMVPEPWHTNI